MFCVLEEHNRGLRYDDRAGVMCATDVADLLSIEELEDIHGCENLEDKKQDVPVTDFWSSKRRVQIPATRNDHD
jgi:hypothetical protein